jgi:hypothetical protein
LATDSCILYSLGSITSLGTTICFYTSGCPGTTKWCRWNNSSDYRAAMASAEGDAGVGAPTPLVVRTVMQAMTLRGLETPVTTVNGGDLSHADALSPGRVPGDGARVTASNSSRDTPGEGHLRPARDQ